MGRLQQKGGCSSSAHNSSHQASSAAHRAESLAGEEAGPACALPDRDTSLERPCHFLFITKWYFIVGGTRRGI